MPEIAQTPTGTAGYKVGKDAPYTIAAKTGTAQIALRDRPDGVLPPPSSADCGTSAVSLLACFGMLMSIHNHRKLLAK